MIILKNKFLHEEDGKVFYHCDFSIDGEDQGLWYSFPVEIQDLILTERFDGFLVGLLFLGLKLGKDIKVNGAVSEKLLYSINYYLINAICLANPDFKRIKIEATRLERENVNKKGATGTGLSCGVDSLSTFYDHTTASNSFSVDYFTIFNVGSLGNLVVNKTRNIFSEHVKEIEKFAKKVNKEVIAIDSNLSEVLKLNFQETHTLRSVSCVLHLQKLFNFYYYASSVRFDKVRLDKLRIAEYDLILLQYLSTESTTFISSVSQYTRIERLALIADEPETFDNLNVCSNLKEAIYYRNCSRCHKCIRTLIALDFLGKLNNFSSVFDIPNYLKYRERYIGEVFYRKNKETLDYELIDFLKKQKSHLSLRSRILGIIERVKFENRLFKKLVKKKIIEKIK